MTQKEDIVAGEPGESHEIKKAEQGSTVSNI